MNRVRPLFLTAVLLAGGASSLPAQTAKPSAPPAAPKVIVPAVAPLDNKGGGELDLTKFPGQVIVEGRILVDDIAELKIGQPMRVAIETFPTSSRGELSTYAFEPAT